MFRLFKKQKAVHTEDEPDRLAQWLTAKGIRFQKRWAGFMQRRMEKLSMRGKKGMVIALCIVSGSYCSRIIYQSFHNRHAKIFSVTAIQAPAHVTETGEATVTKDVIITEAEYQRVRHFHQYVDSLYATNEGKTIADSLLLQRPGLMDSIYRLEQLYQLQISKIK